MRSISASSSSAFGSFAARSFSKLPRRQVAHVEHLRAQERPDFIQRAQLEHVAVDVGHLGNREVGAHRRRAHGAPRGDRRRRRGTIDGRGQRLVLRQELGLERGAARRVHDALHEVEPVHGVLGVDHRALVRRRDARAREAVGQRGAADEDRQVDARGLQVPAVTTICCAVLTSRPDRPITSGACSFAAAINVSGGTLMPRFTTV